MAVEQEFRARLGRRHGWGVGLLVVAALLWVYAGWEMFVPYSADRSGHCSAPAFADHDQLYTDPGVGDPDEHDHDKAVWCAQGRDWPQPLAALLVSTPLGITGAMLATSSTLTLRLREHDDERRRAESAAARKAKS
ncbi:hypothetical protein [Streptomyces sp. CA-111067]|uniref:hypothetical protein n=1 Tax=Streptomyces sp. CA-111067 TaxID=3240046 RepID=UPI003D9605DA